MVTIGGFPPVQALRSVTSIAAQACGVAVTKGRIAPGHDAWTVGDEACVDHLNQA